MVDVWILCDEDETTGELTGIGIASTEAKAKDLASDGLYKVIPITVNQLYSDIISAGIIGAVSYEVGGLQALIELARTAILDLRSDISGVSNRLGTLENQMTAVINQGQQIQTDLSGVSARVYALENP